jgi:hypothetical protein
MGLVNTQFDKKSELQKNLKNGGKTINQKVKEESYDA